MNVLGTEDGQCAVADTHFFLGKPGASSRTYNLAPRAPVQQQLEIGACARCFCLRRGWETARVRDLERCICLCSSPFSQPDLLGGILRGVGVTCKALPSAPVLLEPVMH